MFCLTTFTLGPNVTIELNNEGLHWGKNYVPVRAAIFLQGVQKNKEMSIFVIWSHFVHPTPSLLCESARVGTG